MLKKLCQILGNNSLTENSFNESESGQENYDYGDWSETSQISTLQMQGIDEKSCREIAQIIKGQPCIIEFIKPGIVTALNSISFGKYSWEVCLELQNAHSVSDHSSCVKLGIKFIYEF